MIFLDTTVPIHIARGFSSLKDILSQFPNSIFGISLITIEEIFAGLGYFRIKKGEKFYNSIKNNMEQLLTQFEIYPITREIVELAGLFRGKSQANGLVIDSVDAIIAVTAELYHAEFIITQNPTHFKFSTVPLKSYKLEQQTQHNKF